MEALRIKYVDIQMHEDMIELLHKRSDVVVRNEVFRLHFVVNAQIIQELGLIVM